MVQMKKIIFISLFLVAPLVSFAWAGGYSLHYSDSSQTSISSFCFDGTIASFDDNVPAENWGNFHQLRAYYQDNGEFVAKNNNSLISGSACLPLNSIEPGRYFTVHLADSLKWVRDSANNGWEGHYTGVDPCTDFMNEEACQSAIGTAQAFNSFIGSGSAIGTYKLGSTTNNLTAGVGDANTDVIADSMGFLIKQGKLAIGSGLGILMSLWPYIAGLVFFGGIFIFIFGFVRNARKPY